jgi:hypothetical protein
MNITGVTSNVGELLTEPFVEFGNLLKWTVCSHEEMLMTSSFRGSQVSYALIAVVSTVKLTVGAKGFVCELSPIFCRWLEFAMSGSVDRDMGAKLQPSLLHTGSAPSRVKCMATMYIQFGESVSCVKLPLSSSVPPITIWLTLLPIFT